jgi:hypothetical protein
MKSLISIIFISYLIFTGYIVKINYYIFLRLYICNLKILQGKLISIKII